MTTVTVWCLTVLSTLALSPVARSTVITFDDLTPRPSDQIPLNYHGLRFSGSPYNGITATATSVIPGVRNGAVSAPNVLLSEGQALSIQPFDAEYGTLFTFNSGYFTSAYDNALNVEAIGFTGGGSFTKVFTLTNEHPTFVPFEWQNLSEIQFQGLPAGIYSNTQFVMDNLTVNETAPEPQTVLLLGIGLVFLSMKQRKAKVLRLAKVNVLNASSSRRLACCTATLSLCICPLRADDVIPTLTQAPQGWQKIDSTPDRTVYQPVGNKSIAAAIILGRLSIYNIQKNLLPLLYSNLMCGFMQKQSGCAIPGMPAPQERDPNGAQLMTWGAAPFVDKQANVDYRIIAWPWGYAVLVTEVPKGARGYGPALSYIQDEWFAKDVTAMQNMNCRARALPAEDLHVFSQRSVVEGYIWMGGNSKLICQ